MSQTLGGEAAIGGVLGGEAPKKIQGGCGWGEASPTIPGVLVGGGIWKCIGSNIKLKIVGDHIWVHIRFLEAFVCASCVDSDPYSMDCVVKMC